MLSPVEGGLAVAVELLELVHLGKESELCNKYSTNTSKHIQHPSTRAAALLLEVSSAEIIE
jgi:hypothetical protein